MDKRDGGGVAFGSEAARLIDQLLREIEGSDLPVTEMLANDFLSLPIYPELLPDRATEIVSTLRNAGALRPSEAAGNRAQQSQSFTTRSCNRRAS